MEGGPCQTSDHGLTLVRLVSFLLNLNLSLHQSGSPNSWDGGHGASAKAVSEGQVQQVT